MALRRLNDLIAKLEGLLLTLILVAMIVLAFTQVVLRNFFNSGITWADPLVRHLVLWVGFIGASVATKDDSHLAIDLVSRFLPKWLKKPTAMFVHAGSAVVCGFLAQASYKFVMGEREMHDMLMPGVPTWWAIAIIPIGFGLMSLRFALRIGTDIRILLGWESPPPETERIA